MWSHLPASTQRGALGRISSMWRGVGECEKTVVLKLDNFALSQQWHLRCSGLVLLEADKK